MSVQRWHPQRACCGHRATKHRVQILARHCYTIRHRRRLREQHQNDLDLAVRGAATFHSSVRGGPSRKFVCPSLFCACTEKQRRNWTVSHEFTAAMIYEMGDVSSDSNAWRGLGFSPAVSPFVALFADPKLYLEKLWGDLVTFLYNFGRALDPILTFFLGVGLQ